jgi:hypothetical protein
MIENGKLMRYAKMALSLGTEVEFLSLKDLHARLAILLSEIGGTPTVSNGPTAGNSDPAPAGFAAIPSTGWPEDLLETVKAALSDAYYRVVMPRVAPEGFSWDRELLAGASIGITFCSAFLAETGSLVIPAGPGMGTLASLLPEVHLAISYVDGCRESLTDYLCETAACLPSRITLVTGPSRTGDIEATMSTGVHGPGRVIHFVLTR